MVKIGEEFHLDARGIKAKGIVTENGFMVLSGSQVRATTASYLNKTTVDLRNKCIADGTICDWVLTKDMTFNSPSTAATFLFGANASGPATWKNSEGISMLKLDKVEKGIMPNTGSEYTGFYKRVEGNEGTKCHYPTRLDTYGCGCGHDCSYCYAKDMITNLSGGWDPEHPKMADITRIENKLRKIEPGTILRLGGLTDCFQPVELQNRVTLETIKLMNKYRIGYLIVTKSHHVADPEYMAIYDPELAHIQITTTTFDPDLQAKYEKASSPNQRIEAIEKLQTAGIDVCLRLSPYVEGWVDFEKLNRVKCDKILVEFLRVNTTILRRFDVDPEDYTVHEAGYMHLPLDKKLEVLSKITGFKEVTVCEDTTEHYDYFRDHFNPNKNDCCNLRK